MTFFTDREDLFDRGTSRVPAIATTTMTKSFSIQPFLLEPILDFGTVGNLATRCQGDSSHGQAVRNMQKEDSDWSQYQSCP
jgi:hypothetical protein